MFSSIPRVAVLLAATAITAPAFAADYDLPFRDSYPTEPGQWGGLGDEDDSLKFEFGIRYWYAMGGQDFSDGGGSNVLNSGDTSHIGELHLRIDDHATNTFAKAMAGYSIAMSGTYSTPVDSGSLVDGHVGYVAADFGWNPWGNNEGSGAGVLVGYQFWEDAPNTGRNNYAIVDDPITYDPVTGQTFVPGSSAPNYVDMHMLRLGVQGKAILGDYFDISAEVVGVPYAKVSGVIGVDDVQFDTSVYGGIAQAPYSGVANGNISWMRTSPTAIDGWGYGGMAEAWLGFHPRKDLTFRLGGRAWYIQGSVDQTFTAAQIGNPGDTEPDGIYDIDPTVVNSSYIDLVNPFSMFRYGLMAEMTYAF